MEKIEKLALAFGIREVYVFGSRSKEIYSAVRGSSEIDRAAASDIDIGVTIPYDLILSIDQKVSITSGFEEIFNGSTVDLTVINEAPVFLALDIIKGELLYCIDAIEQARNEMCILRQAGDLEYFERERRNAILYGDI
ncbi:MAG TPA: nucleotidyltransferase domain-containing protein [Spirochaetota bacterium]|nr:nucleotidyltransferase domain-containing protein [Spirochaetota bacterium]HQP49471.1 nucleotidyltransferase domain-containing protein [Spirochaetota bacterium]